ncbi:TPA: prephenate dehydratase [Candidatus Poribacteria bacterium]|nr:prephenate dehydratase [Candidatus Poribacteria bacterium]
MNDIEKLRKKIDEIDAEILNLLNQRTELALQIGKVKSQNNDNVYVPHREKAIIERLKSLNTGRFPNNALEATYREIFSASRSLEKPISVAYLGPEGSFGHAASIKHFGSSTNYIPIQPQIDIFIEVESGRADYGVVAIENSLDGGIRETQDMFMESNLQICAEIMMPVSHNLLSNSPAEKVKKIYSHPQPFAQCRNWLRNNFKNAEQIAVSSTSEAAMLAAEEENAAAIASKLAAKLYGVKILYEGIQDRFDNMTRFVVIGKHCGGKSNDDKTSIIFAVKDRVGALCEVLEIFRNHNINLAKIQSRPSRTKPWDYVFFTDLEGHIEDKTVKATLDDLEDRCPFFKFLGSYPRA